MENETITDRRKYPRTPLDLEIEVGRILSEDESVNVESIRCKCRDISGGGISFYSMNAYPLQSVLRLQIPLDDLNIKVMGKVMWSKRLPSTPSYIAGVEFLNIYEQDFNVLCSYIMTKCL